ncbi:hypothetical protein [Rhizobium leguminosarum]
MPITTRDGRGSTTVDPYAPEQTAQERDRYPPTAIELALSSALLADGKEG